MVATLSWSPYGWETTHASVTTNPDKTLGHGLRLTNVSLNNNLEKIYGDGYRDAKTIATKKFDGMVNADWALSNPWWIYALTGAKGETGSGPYTHTFTTGDTIPSFTIEDNINSSTASVRKLLGCQIASATISASVNEVVRVRADIPFANESFGESTSTKVAPSEEVFTFAHGTVEIPDGTTIAYVQNFDLIYANELEKVFGLGSRFAQAGPVKNTNITCSETVTFDTSALLKLAYEKSSATAPATLDVDEIASLQLTFTNGLTSTSERSITTSLATNKIGTINIPQDPTAIITQSLTHEIESLTNIVAINNTTFPN